MLNVIVKMWLLFSTTNREVFFKYGTANSSRIAKKKKKKFQHINKITIEWDQYRSRIGRLQSAKTGLRPVFANHNLCGHGCTLAMARCLGQS